MRIHHLKDDIRVFGCEVKDFPEGKKEARENFIRMYEDQSSVFYGIGEMNGPDFKYSTAATQKPNSGTDEIALTEFLIEEGDYLTLTLKDWQQKTDLIKGVFDELLQHDRANQTRCIEWYKGENELVCMVKCKAWASKTG